MEFSGRTTLVTGSSRNIGRAIATQRTRRGRGRPCADGSRGVCETVERVEVAGGRAAVALGDPADADAGVALLQPPPSLEPLVRQIHVAVADGHVDGG